MDGRYAGGMSEATPTPVEPPTPSAEQLAEWRTLVEGVRQGDRSQVVAWDEDAAAGPADTYQVLVAHRSTSSSAAPRPWWPARWLASSPSFGWIPPRPA